MSHSLFLRARPRQKTKARLPPGSLWRNKKGGSAMKLEFYDFKGEQRKAVKLGERLAWVITAVVAAAKLLCALGIIG